MIESFVRVLRGLKIFLNAFMHVFIHVYMHVSELKKLMIRIVFCKAVM